MNALVNQGAFGALPAAFQGMAQVPGMNDEFGGGIVAGFPVISIKGKTWRVKSRGEETVLKNRETGDPVYSLELVIVKATPNLTKVYYPGGYVEGSTEKPACWSSDGLKPDAAVETKKHSVCATCPMNQFGSKVSEGGKQVKACSDSKRLAVVPAGNFEEFGSPLLLRIPAATLAPFKDYADRMSRNGFPIPAIVTRVSFDAEEAFPKLVFREVRPLSNDEAARIVELRSDPRVTRILAEATEIPADAEPKSEVNFEQAPTTSTQAMEGIGKSTALKAAASVLNNPPQGAKAAPQAADAIAEAQAQVLAQNAAMEAAARAQAEATAQGEAEMRARIEAEVRARIEAEARAKVQAAKPAAAPVEDAVLVSEQPADPFTQGVTGDTGGDDATKKLDDMLDGLLAG